MVILEIGGQFLEVNSGQLKFNITFRSTIFEYFNSFVFNFIIPYTDHNARVFEFPLHLNKLSRQKVKKSGSIIIDGIRLSGIWSAGESGEDFIELSFEFGAEEFTGFIENKNLPELFNEKIVVPDIIDHVAITAYKTYPDTPYQFPSVYNPELYGDVNPYFAGVINYFERFFVNKNSNANTIVPMLYFPYIIQRIFNQAGFKVEGSIFDDPIFNQAIIYNHFTLDKLVTEYFKGNLYDTDLSDSTNYIIVCNSGLENVGNNYNVITGKFQCTEECYYRIKVKVTHKPYSTPVTIFYTAKIVHEFDEFSLPNIIASESGGFDPGSTNSIATNFDINYMVSTDPLGVIYLQLMYYEDSVLVTTKIIEANVEIISSASPAVNIYQNEFNLKNHVPDMDISEFLSNFFNQYQVVPVFDNISKTVTLIHFSEVMKKLQNLQLSEGLVRNSLKVTPNEFDGVEFSFAFSGNDSLRSNNNEAPSFTLTSLAFPAIEDWIEWPFFTSFFVQSLNACYQKVSSEEDPITNFEVVGDIQNSYKLGNGTEPIQLEFSPMAMRNFFNSHYVACALPAVSAQGTSEAYKLKNETPLRMMVFVGFVGIDGVENSYPFATTTKYDSSGNEVLPINITAREFADRYWLEKITWLSERFKIEFNRQITAKELFEIALDYKQLFLESHILIEEMFAVIDQELKEIQVKGYTA